MAAIIISGVIAYIVIGFLYFKFNEYYIDFYFDVERDYTYRDELRKTNHYFIAEKFVVTNKDDVSDCAVSCLFMSICWGVVIPFMIIKAFLYTLSYFLIGSSQTSLYDKLKKRQKDKLILKQRAIQMQQQDDYGAMYPLEYYEKIVKKQMKNEK